MEIKNYSSREISQKSHKRKLALNFLINTVALAR
jgi:hypothetical protein